MPDSSSWQMAIVIVVLLSAAGWWMRRLWRMLSPSSKPLAGACGGCSACPSAATGAARPGGATTTFIPLETLVDGTPSSAVPATRETEWGNLSRDGDSPR